MNQARLAAGFELFAQIADVDLDHLGFAAEVVPPDPFENHSAIEHLVRVLEKEPQEFVLGCRERDPARTAPPFPQGRIQAEVGEPKLPAHDRGFAT